MRMLFTTLLAATASSLAIATGPDLLITDMRWPVPGDGVEKVASVSGESAYAIATFTCNIGDTDADWNGGTADHPLIAQNLYRFKNNRFEQIALGWPKHAAAVVSQAPSCGPCAFMGQVTFFLAPGCMDPYDAFTNATQTRLSPRSEVNPATGQFTFPFDTSQPPTSLDRRLRVQNAEIDPAAHPGARFFIEAQMIAKDDAASGNDLNNSSYRELAPGTFTTGGYPLTPNAPAVSGQPAIFAWAAIDPQVQIERIDIPGDGSFYVASRAFDNKDGTWDYEYAVMNYNSDRAASAFTITLDSAASTPAVGFTDIHHHSGEPFDTTDWTPLHQSNELHWSTDSFATDPNANALRWGTLYNFRVRTDRAPEPSTARLSLYKAGTPAEITVPVVAPSSVAANPADLNTDGCVDSADLAMLLAAWGTPATDLDADGTTGSSDLAILLAAWTGTGC